MVAVKSLTTAIVNFISNVISNMSKRFAGKQAIIDTNAKRNTIQDLIDKAIRLNQHITEATETQNDFNYLREKMDTTMIKYNLYIASKNLYDNSVRDLVKYRRQKRRAVGRNRVAKQVLIDRAIVSRDRRKITMDAKWDTFIVKIKQAGAAAITVLASYATLKSFKI